MLLLGEDTTFKIRFTNGTDKLVSAKLIAEKSGLICKMIKNDIMEASFPLFADEVLLVILGVFYDDYSYLSENILIESVELAKHLIMSDKLINSIKRTVSDNIVLMMNFINKTSDAYMLHRCYKFTSKLINENKSETLLNLLESDMLYMYLNIIFSNIKRIPNISVEQFLDYYNVLFNAAINTKDDIYRIRSIRLFNISLIKQNHLKNSIKYIQNEDILYAFKINDYNRNQIIPTTIKDLQKNISQLL